MENKTFNNMNQREQQRYLKKYQKEFYKRIIKDESFIDRVQYRIIYSWVNFKKVFNEHHFLKLSVEVIVSILILYFLNNVINYFFMVR